jgi:hypothetical protein
MLVFISLQPVAKAVSRISQACITVPWTGSPIFVLKYNVRDYTQGFAVAKLHKLFKITRLLLASLTIAKS